jgi:hypothetical protein
MGAVQTRRVVQRSAGSSEAKKMGAKASDGLFVWNCLLRNEAATVIVMPSPHSQYKSGISYSDALASGEIYASLHGVGHVDTRIPEFLGQDVCENLILIGGKKANPIARDFQALKHTGLIFDLDDGVIYDKQKQVVLTPEYASGQERTVANLVADYGLIVYTDNPLGKSTKIVHLAGIKGGGTLAAAIAAVDPRLVHQIEKSLRQLLGDGDSAQLKNLTVEILIKVSAANGRVRRDSIEIEKISVSNGRSCRTWESEKYSQLKAVVPHRLLIHAMRTSCKPISVRARIDDQEIKFAKSTDRLNAIYFLARQAREDYLNESGNEGWLSAFELAQKLWQITHKNGAIEISEEMKRHLSEAIKRWATHLQRRGKLTFSDNIELDSRYVNSEILVLDSDIKKKIVDLVHMINHEQKNKYGPGFQLIESKCGLGYRINIHPALIFITESPDSSSA